MEGGKLQDRKVGSVKAVITSYRQQILEDNPAKNKFETNYSKKPCTETRELHEAKNTVKDLTQKIEESNSRAKAQMAKRREEEWNQIEEVMKEVESVKRDLSKLKVDTASILEETRRAEKEMNSSMSKALSYSSSVEALNKEIEEINEELVLVEVARIEASKECREIEAQRRENAAKHSIIMKEMQKKNLRMIQQIEDAKELETKLARTKSDINRLESKLKQVQSNFHEDDVSASASLFEAVTRELEATKKEMASVEVERFEFTSSMEVIRNELGHVSEEADTYKKKEVKAHMNMQSLNSLLLRAKAKLEALSAGAENARSTESNLSHTLEQIKSESKKAEKEQSMMREETALMKTEVQKTETEIESVEERLQAALKNLEAVKSSEAIALENLQTVIQNTIRKRALSSQNSTTITISKFEYDYLKGNAAEATQIADKKVEAAQAWIEALKASEKQIVMKTDVSRRERGERSVEKELDIPKTEGSVTSRRVKGRKSASWIRGGSRPASFTLRRRK